MRLLGISLKGVEGCQPWLVTGVLMLGALRISLKGVEGVNKAIHNMQRQSTRISLKGVEGFIDFDKFFHNAWVMNWNLPKGSRRLPITQFLLSWHAYVESP